MQYENCCTAADVSLLVAFAGLYLPCLYWYHYRSLSRLHVVPQAAHMRLHIKGNAEAVS